MNVIISGLATEYSIKGSGPVVLLLHGWGDTKATFGQLVENLSSKYTTISVDLPGFGGTETPHEIYDLHKYAVFVAEFVKKVTNQSDIYAIIGHSNGGAIALKLLAMDQLSTDRLVLLASSGVRSTDKARKKALYVAAKAAKVPIRILPKSTQSKIKKKVYTSIGSDQYAAEGLQESFRKVVAEDLIDQISGISAKTLLIYGDEDRATPVSYGEMIKNALQNAELDVVRGAGHFLHSTHASMVVEKTSNFLGKNT